MKFNKDNLYDYDKACESLIGCKGYFGSSMEVIKWCVENEDLQWLGTVKKINSDDSLCRYQTDLGDFYYFYKVD